MLQSISSWSCKDREGEGEGGSVCVLVENVWCPWYGNIIVINGINTVTETYVNELVFATFPGCEHRIRDMCAVSQHIFINYCLKLTNSR